MCSIMVASAIGTMAMMAVRTRELFVKSTPPKTVLDQWIGEPIQAASLMGVKSTSWHRMATM